MCEVNNDCCFFCERTRKLIKLLFLNHRKRMFILWKMLSGIFRYYYIQSFKIVKYYHSNLKILLYEKKKKKTASDSCEFLSSIITINYYHSQSFEITMLIFDNFNNFITSMKKAWKFIFFSFFDIVFSKHNELDPKKSKIYEEET